MRNDMDNFGCGIYITGIDNMRKAIDFAKGFCYGHIISRNRILAQMEVVYEGENDEDCLTDVSYIRRENIQIVVTILRKLHFTGKAIVYHTDRDRSGQCYRELVEDYTITL